MSGQFDEFFTEVRHQDGKRWVRLDEVIAILPEERGAAAFDPGMQEVLREGMNDGCAGIVVLWVKEANQMATVSSVFDCDEIAEALEHAAKRYRDPEYRRSRGIVDLS